MKDAPPQVETAISRTDVESLAELVETAEANEVVLALDERRNTVPVDALLRLKTTGVHITCSMRCAPVASITSRSKPSAIPDACGICAKAARKSSSTG